MCRWLRNMLFLIVAGALIGGTTLELAHSASYGSVLVSADMPCDMAMAASASGDAKPMPPCKGMTPECIKLMGCVTVSALPGHFLIHEAVMQYSVIDYWTSVFELDGLDREPEPLPPRTA
ncbi:MAG TPA: hypothetical protein VM689_20880 [Aliidongia sp.]|nr:hypothetical protein [Aliidongia sp.]